MYTDKQDRPNILWICTDQQRYDTIGALGNPYINTPNLDALCAQGVAFTHAYCQNPICTPSRASFLTGLYPSATHVNRNGNARYPCEGPKTITRHLADAGYYCGLVGKLHIASPWLGEESRTEDGYAYFRYSHSPHQHNGTNHPATVWSMNNMESCGNAYLDWLRGQGIHPDTVFNTDGKGRWSSYLDDAALNVRQTHWCALEATDFIEKNAKEKSWLLSVNLFDPHPPFDGPEPYRKQYLQSSLPRPAYQESDLARQIELATRGVYFQTEATAKGDAIRATTASYYASIEHVDNAVGELLAALERTNQRESTIIIFMSDHGEMLGDHGLLLKGCRFYEGLVRVPLIISWPGHFKEGSTVTDLVELTDVTPSLAELGGISLDGLHGRSLLPYLQTDSIACEPRTHVCCEYLDTLSQNQCFGTMYRDSRWKLIHYHGKHVGELYDLENDPQEFENRWDDRSLNDLKARMTQQSFDRFVMASDLGPAVIGRY